MSAAFVAVTVHEPADVADSVEPDTEHPAVPELVTEYVTAPEPEPPDVVNAKVEPYVADVDETVRADWLALFTVKVMVEDDIDA